jgi:hypothetical protein
MLGCWTRAFMVFSIIYVQLQYDFGLRKEKKSSLHLRVFLYFQMDFLGNYQGQGDILIFSH